MIIDYSDEAYIKVSENMVKYGGSFVKKLGEAIPHADPINKKKLAKAFSGYFARYLMM